MGAMLLVGYNERKQVFIVRNSWGRAWGQQGYGYLPYSYVGSAEFNMGRMFALRSLAEVDLTPHEDDGQDPELSDDQHIIQMSDHLEDEEADEDDDTFGLEDLFEDVQGWFKHTIDHLMDNFKWEL